MYENCNLCPNDCGVNRETNKGRCGESNAMRIAKYYLHPYEEPFISGNRGSGAVFFSGCGLKCAFCQNYELSRSLRGKVISAKDLSDIFLELENMGAHNINLVNPTHFLDGIYEAVKIRRPNIPIVYNTHGYEKEQSLETADKFVDIYLPDLKFYSPAASLRYTGISKYFEVASKAILFMMNSRKTVISDGIMQSGVCIRHLILPLNTSDSIEILHWFAKNQINGAYFSLMAQYTPFGKIDDFPELKRPITKKEYERVFNELYSLPIDNYLLQERSSAQKCYIPSWDY